MTRPLACGLSFLLLSSLPYQKCTISICCRHEVRTYSLCSRERGGSQVQ